MNKIPTLLLLLSLLLLQACGDPKHVTDVLHRAEACMNEHPDSALALLKSVSPDEIKYFFNNLIIIGLFVQIVLSDYEYKLNANIKK